MRKNRKTIQIGIGACSVLMIFVVLCMMILSVLSYSKAAQKEAIADRERYFMESYAAADAVCLQLIDELQLLSYTTAKAYANDQKIQAYCENKEIQITWTQDLLILEKTVNEQQQLHIELQVKNGKLQVLCYELKAKGV